MQSAEEPSKKQFNKTDLKGLLQVVGMCPRCCHWVFCLFSFYVLGFFFVFFVFCFCFPHGKCSHSLNVPQLILNEIEGSKKKN